MIYFDSETMENNVYDIVDKFEPGVLSFNKLKEVREAT